MVSTASTVTEFVIPDTVRLAQWPVMTIVLFSLIKRQHANDEERRQDPQHPVVPRRWRRDWRATWV